MAAVAQSNQSPPTGGEDPVKDEDATNVQDEDMAENGKADQEAEDEDGEPKTKRAKAEVTEAPDSLMETEQVEMFQPVSICPAHDERLKLYCEDDGVLSCIICRDSMKHKNHNFLPILEAVEVYKPQLPPMVTPLQEALKVAKQWNSQQSEKIEQHKSDMEERKQQAVTEFKRLQAILREQEEKMLKQLEQEQEKGLLTMETNLSKLQENEEKLEQALADAEEKMKATDTNTFLTGMKSLLVLYEEQKTLSTTHAVIDKKPSKQISKESIQESVRKAGRSLIPSPAVQKDKQPVKKPATTPQSAEKKNQPQPGKQPDTASQLAVQKKDPQPVQQPTGTPIKELLDRMRGMKHIWLIGDGLLHKAKGQARYSSYGTNLGFPKEKITVHWKTGKNEPIQFDNLIREMKKTENSMKCLPDVLLIHLGDMYLNRLNHDQLAQMVKCHLRDISKVYPRAVVMWSYLISRHGYFQTPVQEARQACNKTISDYAQTGKYFVVPHKEVENLLSERWQQPQRPGEGVANFTQEELNAINGDFISAIEKAIRILVTGKQ